MPSNMSIEEMDDMISELHMLGQNRAWQFIMEQLGAERRGRLEQMALEGDADIIRVMQGHVKAMAEFMEVRKLAIEDLELGVKMAQTENNPDKEVDRPLDEYGL